VNSCNIAVFSVDTSVVQIKVDCCVNLAARRLCAGVSFKMCVVVLERSLKIIGKVVRNP